MHTSEVVISTARTNLSRIHTVAGKPLLHIAQQLSDLFVESLSDTAERETRIQLAALNNYPGRRKKNRRPHQFEFSLRPLVAASTITYGIA